ncbi:AAA family ATPase [Herbidospora sp. NEAU-GS84]|uniref:AAA family ATPase n=1 Tax=Herbidospora solisilvae TaxID=2696284 RepID=A0A7C9JAC3_9ACTN|nr:ATP-binding protein [Herbidospora solisilvae]NAS24668.1 AAA family ATPase [Herbidospora solisilvae]
MITHIRIDGFKSFLDFELDVPPLLALVGPNSSGKSNLFDALTFLREAPFPRALIDSPRGRSHELFHQVNKGDPVVFFHVVAETLTRFEADLLAMVNHSEAGQSSGPRFAFLLGHTRLDQLPESIRAGVAETSERVRQSEFDPAQSMALLHGERETWRLYQPDPVRMRNAADEADRGALRSDGGNLAAVLGRLHGTSVFDDLVNDFLALTPDVVGIEPYLDERRGEWLFDVLVDGEGKVASRLLSDGTLRILGFLAALHDPDHPGVILVEEIENGLHPSRLAELLQRIERRVTDFNDPASLNEPLRQVIMTTHSPVVVSELYRLRRESLIFLNTAVRVDPENDRVSRVTVAKPVRDGGEPGTFVSPRQVRAFLSTVGPV